MTAREQILGRLPAVQPPQSNAILPEASAVQAGQVDLFRQRAEQTVSTTDRIPDMAGLPAAVNRYLAQAGLPADVVTDDFESLQSQDWQAAGLVIREDGIQPDGDVYVSHAYAGLAEFGAVVASSLSLRALGNAFLAETHIVALPADRIVGSLESYWQLLRAEHQQGLPREFCFINGPSRTGDLGLPAKLGAHGPARVHVVIVG